MSTFKELWWKLSAPAGDATAPVDHAEAPVVEAANDASRIIEPKAPAAYDLSLLQGMVGADSPALHEIVQKFIQNTPAELDRLERAVAAYDLPAVGAQAHRLKSQVKLFGLVKAGDALQLMEQTGKGQLLPADPAVLRQGVEEVRAVYEGALRELSKKYRTA
jgi:HPt (histidine-containing phosphotransfer) domain-containing protein